MVYFPRCLWVLSFVAFGAAQAFAETDVLLSAMKAELDRSFQGLEHAEKTPLYFLGYEVWDSHNLTLSAVLGALQSENEYRERQLSVDARVGSRKVDNYHQMKGPDAWRYQQDETRFDLPVEDDAAALRAGLWRRTDGAFKDALDQFTKVKANKAVTATEEDSSDDFSPASPVAGYAKVSFPAVDLPAWRDRLRRLSKALKPYPFVFQSEVWLSVSAKNRYLVNTDGTQIVTGDRYLRLSYTLSSRTSDGMELERYKPYDGQNLEDFPSDEKILADMRKSAAELEALVKAPLVSPYTGPAIIRNHATGVYFHEILGHRLEGHRQKYEGQGQTFTKMIGKQIVAPFISVYDDPTLERHNGVFLRGHYAYDDEGTPAARVHLIDRGILKNFLLSRMPIAGFARSNGHGRRSSGHHIVPRMANLMIEASETVPYETLRARLLEEVRRQKKPYGLILDDISGGFTVTSRDRPQSFKVLPLLVYRVYPDGRPDEPVRGVDIVGTPLTAFTKILAAADDAAIFNGTCGAESGWVPVSAVAPSVLISEIEVEKKEKTAEKPPVLPLPFHDPTEKR